MNKAVLVMNKMPKCCIECDLELHVDYGSVWLCVPGDGDGFTKVLSERNWHERPDWCPLCSEPERRLVWYDDSNSDYELGWNACIDMIFGEDIDEEEND